MAPGERGDVRERLKAYEPELIAIRRDLHRHPETAFEEARTAKLVADLLRGWGLEVTEGVAKTGVVGVLKGARPGNGAIALRADMDALDILEVEGRPHGSTIPGKMHACGHDGHTAMLLGAARYLAEHGDFGGAVHFVFQPAEEGHAGGRVMIEEGLFERFPADAVYGMHNIPGMAEGTFALRKGPFLAAGDSWTATFSGTGGHGGGGAHLATDPTLAAAQFVLALQTIVSRNVPAIESAVVSVGSLRGGDPKAPNIIPSEVVVRGTARSYKPEIRDLMERRLKEIAASCGEVYGCGGRLDYNRRYPALVNHGAQSEIAAAAARALVGDENVSLDAEPRMFSEDFSYMLQARPGAFIFIGAGARADGEAPFLHTPDYDFNDAILTLGSAYWVSLVQSTLGGEAP
jgi:hippurate hydrolase